MSLNPEDRKNWQGFLDLLQPPPGYRLAAAVGTTYGLSIEALIAALLSMCNADGEELASNPVAATMAITRMCSKVRVLVQPATTTGPPSNSGSNRFIALLDRLVVEVQPKSGLFHPKVWALRFEHIGNPKRGTATEVGRVLVGSRNLTRSTSFEVGAAFEGGVAGSSVDGSPFGADVARALRQWFSATKVRYPDPVWQLPRFVGALKFDTPVDAETALRLRWQGMGEKALSSAFSDRWDRALVVSPFIQPDFVADILGRTNRLHIVSIPESLDALPDDAFAALDARASAQGSPVLYQVTNHGNPDDACIEGIHAKLLLTEDSRQREATFVGSSNATGPGWGLAGPANVEAMVEMRPGIGIDRFIHGFIRENRTKVHPWVSEYDRSARADVDPERETERRMLAALREVAKLELVLNYDDRRDRLTLSKSSRKSVLAPWVFVGGLRFSVAPLLLVGEPGTWRPISDLEGGTCQFEDVPLAKLTAFVALRVQSPTPPLEKQRFVIARLEVTDQLLDERDGAIRGDIMATADPAMILNALVRGLAHIRSVETNAQRDTVRKTAGLQSLLAETNLERLLQAVALDSGLVNEMRLLLGPVHGKALLGLCDDLEEALGRIAAEVAP